MGEEIVIEFGSNSCKIMQHEGQQIKADYRIPLRLIAALDEMGGLSEGAIQNMINIISDVQGRFPDSKHYHLIATEALRKAQNSAQVRDSILHSTGLKLRILSPIEEAEAAFRGVQSGLDITGKVLVFDIGGASTELIIGTKDTVQQSYSYPLGAAILSAKFRRTDPIQHCGYNCIEKEMKKYLKLKPISDITLIGTGGALSTMAAVHLQLANYDPEALNGHILSRAEVYRQLQLYRGFPVEDIAKIPGMDPTRADIILPATMVTLKIMELMDLRALKVSTHGVRHGIMAIMKEIPA